MATYPPRAWQIEAMKRWTDAGHRGIISVVTGGGKTIFALWCIAKLRPDTTLIVVPTAALLEQWWEEAAFYFSISLEEIHIVRSLREIEDGKHQSCGHQHSFGVAAHGPLGQVVPDRGRMP